MVQCKAGDSFGGMGGEIVLEQIGWRYLEPCLSIIIFGARSDATMRSKSKIFVES